MVNINTVCGVQHAYKNTPVKANTSHNMYTYNTSNMNASLTGTLIIIFSKQVLEHAGAILSALNWEFVCSISILL